MKKLTLILPVILAQAASAETELLLEVARCQGQDIQGTLSIYARYTDMQKKPLKTTGTLQMSNGPFGPMLFQQSPMQIKDDGSLSINFEMRGENNILIANTKTKIGKLTAVDAPAGAGLDLECLTPEEAKNKRSAEESNSEPGSKKQRTSPLMPNKKSGRMKGDGLNTDL
jgi:hypothetical protein